MKAGEKTVLTFTNEGSYETKVEDMQIDMIHREKAPYWVKVDGRNFLISCTEESLKKQNAAGITVRGLKSVQIKYKNPKKDYEAIVSFEQFDMIGM